jgi:uncharacterized membrane protein YeaQ/YmgE (transglycosylase-associated protein family)
MPVRQIWAPACRSGSRGGEGAPDALQCARLRLGPAAGDRVDRPADEPLSLRREPFRHDRAAGGDPGGSRPGRWLTAATLAGVLAIYLLAGMFFSFIYGVIGAADADALFAQLSTSNRQDQLYFSFVTLCTVGYGDLTPAGGVPRAFAVTEMLVGQIYLVTIVSLIVSNLGARRRA